MKLDIFINDIKIDLFKDEAIVLNDSIQEIQDISKVFTPFTQQFNVPASSTNNKLFKHYYNYEIENGFDARFRQPSRLVLNGATFKTGKVQLSGVSLKNSKVASYKIVFYGSTASLNDIFANKQLKDLYSLDAYDFGGGTQGTFSVNVAADMVATGFQAGGTLATNDDNRNIIAPFSSLRPFYGYSTTSTTLENNLAQASLADNGVGLNFAVRNMCGAIKIVRIIEAIQTQFPEIEFNMADEVIDGKNVVSFFDSPVFKELYLLLHREATARDMTNFQGITLSTNFGFNFGLRAIKTGLGVYNYNANQSTAPNLLSNNNTEFVAEQQYNYTFRFRFITQFNVSANVELTAVDKTTGELLGQAETTVTQSTASVLSIKDINSGTEATRTFLPIIKITNQKAQSVSFDALGVIGITGEALNIGRTDRVTGAIIDSASYGRNNFQLTEAYFIQDNTPQLKIIDLLSGLFKQFNLTAYTLETNPNKIYVQTFDDYMTLGNTRDITKYVDITKKQIARTVPFSQIDFEYAKPKDATSLRYVQKNGRQMGNLDYSAPLSFEGRAFKLQVPFAHIVQEIILRDNITRTPILILSLLDAQGKAVLTPPYVFFNNRTSNPSYPITTSQLTVYNKASNISSNGNHTLHFGREIDDDGSGVVDNSLFERFYKQYIQQAFEKKGRILKVTAILPLSILLNYKLNDILVIAGREFYINKIKTNLQTKRTQLELINKITPYTASVLS